MNDPCRQIEKLQQALASDKSRIAFLLGAGCPFSIRIKDGDDSSPLIPDFAELKNLICKNLAAKNIDKLFKSFTDFIDMQKDNCVAIHYKYVQSDMYFSDHLLLNLRTGRLVDRPNDGKKVSKELLKIRKIVFEFVLKRMIRSKIGAGRKVRTP